MSAVSNLYDGVILDHIKNARNYRILQQPDRVAEGLNPLCGDSFTIYVELDGEVVRDASFQCSCCGISMASASVMTEAVKGRTVTQTRELYRRFVALLSEEGEPENTEHLGEVAVLAVVRAFPSRLNCAALAWHTLVAALEGRQSMVLGSETTA